MKKTVSIPIFFAVFFGITSLVEGQTLSGQKITLIENQIDDIFHNMLALAEKFKYDELSDGVDDKHHAGFIMNGNYYSDYAYLIEVVKSSAQDVRNQHIAINNKKITVLSDRIALLTTWGTSQVIFDAGNEFKVNFYWSFVFEKINGEWRVIHSHQSRAK